MSSATPQGRARTLPGGGLSLAHARFASSLPILRIHGPELGETTVIGAASGGRLPAGAAPGVRRFSTGSFRGDLFNCCFCCLPAASFGDDRNIPPLAAVAGGIGIKHTQIPFEGVGGGTSVLLLLIHCPRDLVAARTAQTEIRTTQEG